MNKRQTAETRKPQIIKAFYETILAEGFEGASIAKVAKRLDMTPTLILHYFGNKENMTLECVNYTIGAYAKLIKRLRPRTDDPEQRLISLLKTMWSREYYEKVHIAASFSIIDISFRNQRVKEKLEELYRLFKVFLVHELTELKAAGMICAADVDQTADVLITMVEGSRHFSHFFVAPRQRDAYHRKMQMAAHAMLTAPLKETVWNEG